MSKKQNPFQGLFGFFNRDGDLVEEPTLENHPLYNAALDAVIEEIIGTPTGRAARTIHSMLGMDFGKKDQTAAVSGIRGHAAELIIIDEWPEPAPIGYLEKPVKDWEDRSPNEFAKRATRKYVPSKTPSKRAQQRQKKERQMSVEDMIAEYVTIAQSIPSPGIAKAASRKKKGLPFTVRQHFLHRRLIETIGEERTNKLIQATIETLDNLLEG